MGWIKLDHVLLTHPKVFKAPESFGLYCMSLLYADHHNTNGFVEEAAIPHLLRGLKGVPRLRQQLITAGLWEEVEGGVQIYNFLKHNRSAEEIAELKAKRAAAGAAGGSKSQANASTVLKQKPSTMLKHVQAEENREEKTREEKALKASSLPTEDDLDFETFWAEYPSQNWPAVPNPKPGKVNAKAQWKRLSPTEQVQATRSLQHYKAYLELSGQQTKHCERYLQQKAFNAYQQPPTAPPIPTGTSPPKGKNARAFEAVIERLGVNDGSDASTADHQVSQRGLPEGRVEPGALRSLG